MKAIDTASSWYRSNEHSSLNHESFGGRPGRPSIKSDCAKIFVFIAVVGIWALGSFKCAKLCYLSRQLADTSIL